jgi:hypothetical protein
MLRRRCAFGDERDDLAVALQALDLHPEDPGADHPPIDLYLALRFSANDQMGCLSR